MATRFIGNPWQKAIWKILTNPTFEVIAVMAAVLVSAWLVIDTDASSRASIFPVLFGRK
ncbi:MAG: hypothetical protein ACM3X5_00050 [Bacillota bacterium]